MKILDTVIDAELLKDFEGEFFFNDIIKCVVDIDRELIAVSAELHADLEQFLLENGSKQESLYGINIVYDTWVIQFDSLINPPRNRAAGYPRAGRTVADPAAREKIEEVVNKWIQI